MWPWAAMLCNVRDTSTFNVGNMCLNVWADCSPMANATNRLTERSDMESDDPNLVLFLCLRPARCCSMFSEPGIISPQSGQYDSENTLFANLKVNPFFLSGVLFLNCLLAFGWIFVREKTPGQVPESEEKKSKFPD